MQTKIYKKNCLGRVPASIRELEECALCENESICLSLIGVPPATRCSVSMNADDSDFSGDGEGPTG